MAKKKKSTPCHLCGNGTPFQSWQAGGFANAASASCQAFQQSLQLVQSWRKACFVSQSRDFSVGRLFPCKHHPRRRTGSDYGFWKRARAHCPPLFGSAGILLWPPGRDALSFHSRRPMIFAKWCEREKKCVARWPQTSRLGFGSTGRQLSANSNWRLAKAMELAENQEPLRKGLRGP